MPNHRAWQEGGRTEDHHDALTGRVKRGVERSYECDMSPLGVLRGISWCQPPELVAGLDHSFG